jgi:holo-[acyl-carrier protein] synthase
MIMGIGTDLVDIRRVEAAILRPGFINRVFTNAEQARAQKSMNPAASYAKRWAAKEACLKAMGIGQGDGVPWTDIEIENNDDGRPALLLHRAATSHMARQISYGFYLVNHISMTDAEPWAQAQVILESRKSLFGTGDTESEKAEP